MMHGFGMGMMGWLWILIPLAVVGGGLVMARLLRHRPDARLDRDDPGKLTPVDAGSAGGGSFARDVFRLARRHDGVLTVSDVVVEIGMEPRRAEQRLNDLVDGERVTMEVTDDGRVRYEFPEMKKG